MLDKPYYNLADQMCRSNGWILGQDKGEMVIGVPQADGSQVSVVFNDFQDSTGQFAIRLWTPVCQAAQLPADQATQLNWQLPQGCLANREGAIVLTATRVFNFTNQADLTHLINTLVYYGAFYAGHYGGGGAG